MWKSKKFILIAVLAVLVLVGSLAGVAFAQTGSASEGSGKTLLARVAAILGIDQQKVENAFAQAQTEMRDEALDNQLKSMVEKGKMTQEQADQYKAWVKARPDTEQYKQQLREWQKTRPGIPPEMKQWQEAMPNMPMPGPFMRGFGFRGFGGAHCLPPATK